LDKNNWSPLHCACNGKHLEICKLLLKAGADVTLATNTDTTALHYVARIPVEEQNKQTVTSLQIARALVEKGAKVRAKNKTEATPLHEAAYKGSEQTIIYLLKQGAQINDKDKYGETPLHYAMRGAKKENIEILLQNGASVEIKGVRGTCLEVVNDKELITLVSTFKKQTENDIIMIKNFDDLPEKLKGHILNIGQTPDFYEVHFETITHVLKFVSRKRIIRGDATIFKTQDPKQFYQIQMPKNRTLSSETLEAFLISTHQPVIVKYRKHSSTKKKRKKYERSITF